MAKLQTCILYLLLAAFVLTGVQSCKGEPEIKRDPEIHSEQPPPSGALDYLASVIATWHYQSPDISDVLKHTITVEQVNTFLRTLDPYSRYLTPEETRFFQIRQSSSRMGIGINLLINGDGTLAVPVIDGPAYHQGLKVAAYIHSIDGHAIRYSDFSSYSFLTQLWKNQPVSIVLQGDAEPSGNEIVVYAREFENLSIYSHVSKDFLMIQVHQFIRGQNGKLKQIFSTANVKGKLIIDLRYCTGGDVYAMVDMLSFLLRKEIEVASLNKTKSQESIELKTLDGQLIEGMPVYIIVSKFTASAAELFTRAMKQHYGNVSVLGEATKGKCLAQQGFEFEDGSSLQLSVYEVYDSQKSRCQGVPIVPDRAIDGIESMDKTELYRLAR